MNMHESYVSLETAKLLKKAGFDWEADTYYQHGILRDGWCSNKNKENLITCSAPTLAVAQKWLGEVKGYHICVQPVNSEVNKETHKCNIEYLVMIFVNNNNVGGVDFVEMIEHFKTHEAAQEVGEKKALEVILEKDESKFS